MEHCALLDDLLEHMNGTYSSDNSACKDIICYSEYLEYLKHNFGRWFSRHTATKTDVFLQFVAFPRRMIYSYRKHYIRSHKQ